MPLRELFNYYFPPGHGRRQKVTFALALYTVSIWIAIRMLYFILALYDPYPTVIEWTLDPFVNLHTTTIPAAYLEKTTDLVHVLPNFFYEQLAPGEYPPLGRPVVEVKDGEVVFQKGPYFSYSANGEGYDVDVTVDGVPVKHFASLEVLQPSKHGREGATSPIGKLPLDRVALAPALGNRLSLSRLVSSGVSVSMPGGPARGELMYLSWGGEFGGNLTAKRNGAKWTIQTMVAGENEVGDLMSKFHVTGSKSWCEVNGWCYGLGRSKRCPDGSEESPIAAKERAMNDAHRRWLKDERGQDRTRKLLGMPIKVTQPEEADKQPVWELTNMFQ